MPRGIPVDPKTYARIPALHAKGVSRNQIAKTLGISTPSVSKWCAEHGLLFDRSASELAVRAAVIDRAARRGLIIDRLYARSEKQLDRLDSADGYSYRIVNAVGSETVTDTAASSADEKNHAAAINMYLTNALKLEAVDGDSSSDAKSMLADLGRALGIDNTQ